VKVQVLSDVEVVPEPGTLALALLGLGVLGGYALRGRTAQRRTLRGSLLLKALGAWVPAPDSGGAAALGCQGSGAEP